MQTDKAQAMLMALWLAAYGDQSPHDALNAFEDALQQPLPGSPTDSSELLGVLPVWLIEGMTAGYHRAWKPDAYPTEPVFAPSQIAGLASAQLICLAVEGEPFQIYLQQLLHLADEISQDFYYALLRLGHVMGWGSYRRALLHLSPSQQPYERVIQALYCVMKADDDLDLCIEVASQSEAAAVGGLAGAVVGARLGSLTSEQYQRMPEVVVNQLRALGDWLEAQKGMRADGT